MKDKYAIAGIGQSRIGKVPEISDYGLQMTAVHNALADAGLKKTDIDGIVTHSHLMGAVRVHHQRVAEQLGIDTAFGLSISAGGATSPLLVQTAMMAIEAGMCETVLCLHGDKRATRRGDEGMETANEFGPEFGMFGATAHHALGMTRHMHEYGTTHNQLGAIAVAFRKHALLNPLAQMKEPMTLDDYHRSRWIVWPFHLLDCCLTSDGAAALIVTKAERAKDLRQPPVHVMGMGRANHSRGWTWGNHLTELAAKESGARAFRMAGITPADVDTAQLYDSYTYIVLATLEDYGFCKKGEGGAFVANGRLELGGALPTNTSGGMLSEAYVEGMLQITEAVRQLRGQAEGRQVPDAEIAVVSGNGGNAVCHSTLILRR
ncbi:MAG: thiolase family protein [Betaproteobacteria bacterium]|nr:thiolase family protein [Betaproteobacteria bacterium]